MKNIFYLKPLFIIFIIGWSANVIAWNCWQKCPSAILSGALECKTYQFTKCPSNEPPAPSPHNDTIDTINGQMIFNDPTVDSCEPGDCEIYEVEYPEIKTRANKDGEFVFHIPDELLDSPSKKATPQVKPTKPELPKLITNSIIIENQLEKGASPVNIGFAGVEQHRVPMELFDENDTIWIASKTRHTFTIIYGKDDIPVIEVRSQHHNALNLMKLVIRRQKQGGNRNEEVVLYYKNTPPIIKTYVQKEHVKKPSDEIFMINNAVTTP